MAIKLKNKHSRAVLLIFFTLTAASLIVLSQYSAWYNTELRTNAPHSLWILKMRQLSIILLAVSAAAWVYPFLSGLETGNEKVFRIPLEIPLSLGIFTAGCIYFSGGQFIAYKSGTPDGIDFLCWFLIWGIFYWLSGCLRQIYKTGLIQYLKENTLIGILLRKAGRGFICIFHGILRFFRAWKTIDFTKKDDKQVLKIAGANLMVLLLLCGVFHFTVATLLLYSVLLFIILRYGYQRVQEKYNILLKTTNEIAKGNLETEIKEDLWIFEPFRSEMEKIQSGLKNAVEKEVKSQQMRTELITNVSHDLKTPLTAIITYVDLLKKEKSEEKREEYIEVLERKSLRLKALIEDLFEISKVSSNNMKLNLVDVDVVNLLKQAKIELEDQIQGASLDFRCSYPEEKLIVSLDSQVTYRIFENLLVNIIKYAMPRTRVYVDVFSCGGRAVISMKNVSAAEITFEAEELTERFVRGDRSRNTEGSGLGLAIAKSFTEIQGGEFRIDTEADLFKVEIRF